MTKKYCEPLDDVWGNFPGRSPKAFCVIWYGTIVAIIWFVDSFGFSFSGKKLGLLVVVCFEGFAFLG